MNTYNRAGAVLIVIALFLFLSAYYYHQQAERHNLLYSEAFSTVISIFFADAEKSGVYQMTSKGYVFTEERGIIFTWIVSVFLCGVSIFLNFIGYKCSANTKLDLPLNFVSVLLVFWIFMTAYQVGLISYL